MNRRFPFILIFTLLIFSFYSSIAQSVGVGTATPNASAQLDVTATNKGFLPPRMTKAQRNGIVNPAPGLIVFCTDCGSGEMQYYDGVEWVNTVVNTAQISVPSVTIGNQVWSTKNLDVVTYRNGDPIPQVTDPTEWANLTTGAWCWYNNDPANNTSFGKLYNWYAIDDARGLAPIGWHIPTKSEWNTLIKFIDPLADTTCNQGCIQSVTAGGAMKSINNSWFSPNTGATNTSGFAGMAAGNRTIAGAFGDAGRFGSWWSARQIGSSILTFELSNNHSYMISLLPNSPRIGYPVRIVKD